MVDSRTAYEEGYYAYCDVDKDLSDNPYAVETIYWQWWNEGYEDAFVDAIYDEEWVNENEETD